MGSFLDENSVALESTIEDKSSILRFFPARKITGVIDSKFSLSDFFSFMLDKSNENIFYTQR